MKNFLQKTNKILLILNLFFIQAYLIRFSIGSYPSNLQEILIGLNALSFLAKIIAEKKLLKIIKAIPKHWIIFGMALLTTISILLVQVTNQIDFLRHLKFLFFALILGFIFLESFAENERAPAIKWMGIGALIFGIFSVTYNLLGFNVTHDLRLLGPLDSAVYLAYYLTPFFLFFTIEALKKPHNKFSLIYALMLGLLIIATRSMGAIGGSFIVISLYLFLNNKILKSYVVKTLLIIVGILIASFIFYTKILPTINTDYSSLDERGQIWVTSLEILKEPENFLKGVGFGQFESTYIENVDEVLGQKPLDYNIIQPHNIFLLFTMHYGILGLLFLIFIIIKIIAQLLKKNSEIRAIALYVSLYFLIHGLIDTPIFKNDMLIILIIFLELAIGPYLGKPETKSNKVI